MASQARAGTLFTATVRRLNDSLANVNAASKATNAYLDGSHSRSRNKGDVDPVFDLWCQAENARYDEQRRAHQYQQQRRWREEEGLSGASATP